MMAVIELKRGNQRRLEKFHRRCQELARSRVSFRRSFAIDQDHIVVRGAEQNSSLRAAMEPQHIAAVVMGGRLNLPTCRDSHPMMLAIDAVFRDFCYVEFQTSAPSTTIRIDRLQIRVVLRDQRIKIAVVTVHPNQDKVDLSMPEVDHENVW
jgi:hypothetical protein